MTDFRLYKWGRNYVIVAHTWRSIAWFHEHWRSRGDPPGSRVTRVLPFLNTLLLFWEEYEQPPYTVSFHGDDLEDEIREAAGILDHEETDSCGS